MQKRSSPTTPIVRAAQMKRTEMDLSADVSYGTGSLDDRLMSALGQSRPGRADGKSGHVGYPPIATESCVAAEFRDVP
jgi:hypothetical protein